MGAQRGSVLTVHTVGVCKLTRGSCCGTALLTKGIWGAPATSMSSWLWAQATAGGGKHRGVSPHSACVARCRRSTGPVYHIHTFWHMGRVIGGVRRT